MKLFVGVDWDAEFKYEPIPPIHSSLACEVVAVAPVYALETADELICEAVRSRKLLVASPENSVASPTSSQPSDPSVTPLSLTAIVADAPLPTTPTHTSVSV